MLLGTIGGHLLSEFIGNYIRRIGNCDFRWTRWSYSGCVGYRSGILCVSAYGKGNCRYCAKNASRDCSISHFIFPFR